MAEVLDPQSAILTALYMRNEDDLAALLAPDPELSIFEAAALGRDDRVRDLLDRDPTLINACSADGNTPLGLAAFFAPASTVRLFLSRGADVTVAARNYMKVQPLHAAIAARNAEAVALLLERGADPNARQQVGYTPLMGAASSGKRGLVDLLLEAGADKSLRADDGKTAADVARAHGHNDLASDLDTGS